MKVLFYGRLAETLGREAQVEGAPATVADLRASLAARCSHAGQELAAGRARACVADTLVTEDFPLAGAPVVEFLPPLSGG